VFIYLMVHSFRKVPTFGRDTIRKFGGSVSSLTKMTARGFEDILQVGSDSGLVLERGLSLFPVLDTRPRGSAP